MIEKIVAAWGWTGIDPLKLVEENAFGNLLIKDNDGRFWRLCPEDLTCEVVATTDKAFAVLCKDEEFLSDWNMQNLVAEAREKLGPLIGRKKYCFKIPGILGGEYGGDNLAMVPLAELVRFSGDLAYKLKDLPEGAKVKLKVVLDYE